MPKINRKSRLLVKIPKRIEKELSVLENDQSSMGVQSEQALTFFNNNHQVERWTEMISNSDNINVAFIKILGEIEVNFIQSIEKVQNNIINAIENKFGTLINQNVAKVYTSTYLKELKQKLEISLPIRDLDMFEEFNLDLGNNIEKQNALRYLFQYLIDGDKGLSNDIKALINAVISPSVQKCYSGVGKAYRGQKKKNFSLTNVYLCMQDVLIEKYKQSAENLKLTGRIGRWLSQISDQYNKIHEKSTVRHGKPNSSDSESSFSD